MNLESLSLICALEFHIWDRTEDMTVSNGWIYYANISDGYKIYRMKLDGSENKKIYDDETIFMTACDNTIYYSNKSDYNKLYKIIKKKTILRIGNTCEIKCKL